VYCEDSPPTITRVPGSTIDCSGAGITSYVVTNKEGCITLPSIAEDRGVFGLVSAIAGYTCGPPCVEIGCPDIPAGWYQAYLQERCYYENRAIASQLSFDIDYINVTEQSLINYDWTPLLVDFNL
jgi:hypothetical protein